MGGMGRRSGDGDGGRDPTVADTTSSSTLVAVMTIL